MRTSTTGTVAKKLFHSSHCFRFNRFSLSTNNMMRSIGNTRTSSSSSSTASTNTNDFNLPVPFTVHSTYRHKTTGLPLRPHGLQWNLPGKSHLTYVPMLSDHAKKTVDGLEEDNDWSSSIQRGIVEAHNRWAYAREQRFAKVQDIQSIAVDPHDEQHITVEWKPSLQNRLFKELAFGEGGASHTMVDMIKQDPAAASDNDDETAEVWINGQFVALLNGPASVAPIVDALAQFTSRRLAYKRSDDGIIRIERYFGSFLRHKSEIFDHVLDNLIAMEDVEALDSTTLIGTATLRDWIMGGMLTSRIWVRKMEDKIQFLRPLYDDDIKTTDRRFDLVYGKDDDKIALVEVELQRLRKLAELSHPFETPEQESTTHPQENKLEEIRAGLKRNRPRRKFFGM